VIGRKGKEGNSLRKGKRWGREKAELSSPLVSVITCQSDCDGVTGCMSLSCLCKVLYSG